MKKLLLSLLVLLGSGAYVWADRGWLAARDEADARAAEADAQAEADTVAAAGTPAESAPPASSAEAGTATATAPAPARPRSQSLLPDAALKALDQHDATLATALLSSGPFHDGQFRGPVADAYYGTVEVLATIEGGRLTLVRAVHAPRSSSTSRYLNGKAIPKLNKQAVRTQSARVDVITGATLTSKAYAVSLAGALQQARL